MSKNVYVIFDKVSNTWGDILQFENDEEALRYFKYNCTFCDWFKDLNLLHLGQVNLLTTNEDVSGVIINSLVSAYKVVAFGSDLEEEVKLLKENQLKEKALHDSIIQKTAAPNFIEDVQKLSRYLSKNDKKRFK